MVWSYLSTVFPAQPQWVGFDDTAPQTPKLLGWQLLQISSYNSLGWPMSNLLPYCRDLGHGAFDQTSVQTASWLFMFAPLLPFFPDSWNWPPVKLRCLSNNQGESLDPQNRQSFKKGTVLWGPGWARGHSLTHTSAHVHWGEEGDPSRDPDRASTHCWGWEDCSQTPHKQPQAGLQLWGGPWQGWRKTNWCEKDLTLDLLFGQDMWVAYSHQQRGAVPRSQSPSDMPSLAKVSSVHFTGEGSKWLPEAKTSLKNGLNFTFLCLCPKRQQSLMISSVDSKVW